jgi:pyridoxine kinase
LIPTSDFPGNHTGYRQVKGTKASAQDIRDIYEGLRQSYLTDFDVLLSGYAPSAEAVEAVGVIARDLRFKSTTKPGSFFWGNGISFAPKITCAKQNGTVLDPVMGDQGRLYVHENVIPAYKGIIRDADLILPNQFEAEYVRTLFSSHIVCLPKLKPGLSRE